MKSDVKYVEKDFISLFNLNPQTLHQSVIYSVRKRGMTLILCELLIGL